MIAVLGSKGAKLNKSISDKSQDILMAKEQGVHVSGKLK
jgi:hypothetical protein